MPITFAGDCYSGRVENPRLRVRVLETSANGDEADLYEARRVELSSDVVRERQAKKILARCGDKLGGMDHLKVEEELLGLLTIAREEIEQNAKLNLPNRIGDYAIIDGAYHFVKREQIGEVAAPLCNFNCLITERIEEDDGAERRIHLALEGGLDSGAMLPPIRVPIKEFYSMSGLVEPWGGAKAILQPGTLVKDRLRYAIEIFSQQAGVEYRQVFAHLGWRRIDGVWTYLHGGSAIIGQDVEVSVDPQLNRYQLPEDFDPQAVVQSLALLDVAPRSITIPLLSTMYLAPLAEWRKPDFTLWLEGQSGAKKSTLVALFMNHFGRFERESPPANWESTANILEKQTFLAKDVPLWIDDYSPKASLVEMRNQERTAQRIIRAQGNLTGRARMRSDTSSRPSYYPRGVVVSTGELHPGGVSIVARMLIIPVKDGDVKVPEFNAAYDQQEALGRAMTGYLHWIQTQGEPFMDELAAQWKAFRSDAQNMGSHSRQPELYAHLLVGWVAFLTYVAVTGAVPQEEIAALATEGRTVLLAATMKHGQILDDENQVTWFLSVLGEQFLQKTVYLKLTDGDSPPDWDAWGWESHVPEKHPSIVTDGVVVPDEDKVIIRPAHNAAFLGWVDDDWLYLLPDATYTVIFQQVGRGGKLLLEKSALWRQLHAAGLTTVKPGRNTDAKWAEGKTRFILKLRKTALEAAPAQSAESDEALPDP